MSDSYIRASEIGDYVYCRRAWWLRRVQGYASRNVRALEEGTAHHERHGRTVQHSVYARKLGYGLLYIAIFVFTFWWLAS